MRLARSYGGTIIRIEPLDRAMFAEQVLALESDIIGGIPEEFRDYNPLNGEWAIKGKYAAMAHSMGEAYVKATAAVVDTAKRKEKG